LPRNAQRAFLAMTGEWEIVSAAYADFATTQRLNRFMIEWSIPHFILLQTSMASFVLRTHGLLNWSTDYVPDYVR